VRFTNVAVVRYKRGGKRFEIACYKNKVMDWRSEATTNLDEVLQIPTIFINVSKGIVARQEDLEKAFGTTDETEILRTILDKGEVQVAGEERKQQYDSLFKDIATIVAEKCVNPETQRPLTVGLVEKAMKDIHFSVNPAKSAKVQALEVIRKLSQHSDFPIERAQMRIKFTSPASVGKELKEELSDKLAKVENEEWSTEKMEMVALIDPGNYRTVDQIVRKLTRGKGSIEVTELTVHEQGDEKIE